MGSKMDLLNQNLPITGKDSLIFHFIQTEFGNAFSSCLKAIQLNPDSINLDQVKSISYEDAIIPKKDKQGIYYSLFFGDRRESLFSKANLFLNMDLKLQLSIINSSLGSDENIKYIDHQFSDLEISILDSFIIKIISEMIWSNLKFKDILPNRNLVVSLKNSDMDFFELISWSNLSETKEDLIELIFALKLHGEIYNISLLYPNSTIQNIFVKISEQKVDEEYLNTLVELPNKEKVNEPEPRADKLEHPTAQPEFSTDPIASYPSSVDILEEKVQEKPFQFVEKMDPEIIYNKISKENPQLIVFILSQISEEKTKTIMNYFDKEKQNILRDKLKKKYTIPKYIYDEIQSWLKW